MAKHGYGHGKTERKSLLAGPLSGGPSKGTWTTTIRHSLADQSARVESLEQLCGAAYQMLGMLGAPENVLDTFAAAANGELIPAGEILPLAEMDFDEVRQRQETIDEISTLLAKNLAARGGRRSTEAKREAARANGRKGGRPRKNAATVISRK